MQMNNTRAMTRNEKSTDDKRSVADIPDVGEVYPTSSD